MGGAARPASRQAYYESTQNGLGTRFVSEVQKAFERIEAMPELYGFRWKHIRAVKVKRFRDVVHYILLSDRIEVVAVIHGSRDASAWQSRI